MSKYIVMMGILALVVVAFIDGENKEKAKRDKVETEILIPEAMTADAVTAKYETEEVVFKCRKEVTNGKATEKSFQIVPLKANE